MPSRVSGAGGARRRTVAGGPEASGAAARATGRTGGGRRVVASPAAGKTWGRKIKSGLLLPFKVLAWVFKEFKKILRNYVERPLMDRMASMMYSKGGFYHYQVSKQINEALGNELGGEFFKLACELYPLDAYSITYFPKAYIDDLLVRAQAIQTARVTDISAIKDNATYDPRESDQLPLPDVAKRLIRRAKACGMEDMQFILKKLQPGPDTDDKGQTIGMRWDDIKTEDVDAIEKEITLQEQFIRAQAVQAAAKRGRASGAGDDGAGVGD